MQCLSRLFELTTSLPDKLRVLHTEAKETDAQQLKLWIRGPTRVHETASGTGEPVE